MELDICKINYHQTNCIITQGGKLHKYKNQTVIILIQSLLASLMEDQPKSIYQWDTHEVPAMCSSQKCLIFKINPTSFWVFLSQGKN